MLWWNRWNNTCPLMPVNNSLRKSTSFIRSTSLLRYPPLFSLSPNSFFYFYCTPNFFLISILFFFFFFFCGSIVETWIQWGCLYRWSEERRGHQRLGILISDFWICFFVVPNWLIILQTWIVRYCELVIALDNKKY